MVELKRASTDASEKRICQRPPIADKPLQVDVPEPTISMRMKREAITLGSPRSLQCRVQHKQTDWNIIIRFALWYKSTHTPEDVRDSAPRIASFMASNVDSQSPPQCCGLRERGNW